MGLGTWETPSLPVFSDWLAGPAALFDFSGVGGAGVCLPDDPWRFEAFLSVNAVFIGGVTPPGPDVGAPGREGLGIPLHVYCGASGFAFILR